MTMVDSMVLGVGGLLGKSLGKNPFHKRFLG